jgi:hypothetical protein
MNAPRYTHNRRMTVTLMTVILSNRSPAKGVESLP